MRKEEKQKYEEKRRGKNRRRKNPKRGQMRLSKNVQVINLPRPELPSSARVGAHGVGLVGGIVKN